MKKFTLTGTNDMHYRSNNELDVWAENVSDGYHTMHELYQHRMALNAALFNIISRDGAEVFKSKLHHDGTMFEGYFIVWFRSDIGYQFSYHYDLKYWDMFMIDEKEKADEWDGHTSNDVIERLLKL